MLTIDDEAAKVWLKQARRKSTRPAWTGMDKCTRPPKGRAACASSGIPHRHCECGLAIDLDHGYCDDCFRRLIAGAPMTDHQAEARKGERLEWLERHGFIAFDTSGIRIVKSVESGRSVRRAA